MTRRTLTFLACLSLLAGGCASPSLGNSDCNSALPGDVDCAPDGDDGKFERWDRKNDPARASVEFRLEYRASELPTEGRADVDPWAASYWPTSQGSTNYRWQGQSTLSPLEKYDVAFHGWEPAEDYSTRVPRDCGEKAHEEYTKYVDSLGPAASFQATGQSRHVMFNGVNDDADKDDKIDECRERIEGWWGLCHAWAPAAVLEPEPQQAVELNGQRFEVSDIKALLLTLYDGTRSYGVGGRCNALEIEHDETNRVVQEECRDINPGAWHVVITNLIGLHKRAFVEDRTGSAEVWNQPLFGYQVDHAEAIDVARANELLGVTGDSYRYNPDAVALYEIKMTTDWLTEGHQDTAPLGTEDYTQHDTYHYILELDADGKIIGGEWVGASRDDHPDFIWVPTETTAGSLGHRGNPSVDLEQVKEILDISRGVRDVIDGTTGEVGGSASGAGLYRNTTTTAVPDNDPEGIESVIAVDESRTVDGLKVSVEITHSHIEDLVVELIHGDISVTLHKLEGGSASDINKTYTLSDFDGQAAAGNWTLRVSDRGHLDVGMLRSFALQF